jgi:hypothetical protein
MDGDFRLDLITGKSTVVLELLSCKDKVLNVYWDPPDFLDPRLDVVDGAAQLGFKDSCPTSQSIDDCIHPTSQSQDWATSNELPSPN